MERWLSIPNSNGYEVSDQGRLRSPRTFPECIKPWQEGRKYNNGRRSSLKVTISTNTGLRRTKVHHLVLETFVGPRPEGCECAHLDGNMENNRLENLKWVTHKENENHKIRHGTVSCGERHGSAKLTNEKLCRDQYCNSKPARPHTHEEGSPDQDPSNGDGFDRDF